MTRQDPAPEAIDDRSIRRPAAIPHAAASVGSTAAPADADLESRSDGSGRCRAWLRYFEGNRRRLIPLPWTTPYRLTAGERAAIEHSIGIFQLGESSEGAHFKALGEAWAAEGGDPAYPAALRLFIAEEQRHAAELGRFMRREGLRLRKSQWTDSVFRAVRRLWGLREEIAVLLVAETVAMVYYRALARATGSPLLETLCRQILRDEGPHLEFQTGTLWHLLPPHGPLRRAWRAAYRLFFRATLLVVWLDHRAVFHAGGDGFSEFWRRAATHFRRIELRLGLPHESTRAGTAGWPQAAGATKAAYRAAPAATRRSASRS